MKSPGSESDPGEKLTALVLECLNEVGVFQYVVCPGARNAHWVAALSSQHWKSRAEVKSYFFFEERSAAFFALGRSHSIQAPVAVVTTSGTAAGELLPAAMEAYYSGIALVMITADRPKRYRGTGAPQCADQVGLFSSYCKTIDLEWASSSSGEDLSEIQMQSASGSIGKKVTRLNEKEFDGSTFRSELKHQLGDLKKAAKGAAGSPIHINICYEEPNSIRL